MEYDAASILVEIGFKLSPSLLHLILYSVRPLSV